MGIRYGIRGLVAMLLACGAVQLASAADPDKKEIRLAPRPARTRTRSAMASSPSSKDVVIR